MGHLTLSFFGAFEAMLGDKPLKKFRSVKAQGLLVYLGLTPEQTHTRDVLAALFWPDEPETVAKQNLRQAVFLLRKVLGDATSPPVPYLLVSRSTVKFNRASDHSLDVADFLTALEQGALKTAASLYQGDLLPGFSCNSLPFDDWLRQERERYHRLAVDALFTLTSNKLAQADYQAAQTLARQQLALEPWREEAHRQLIQALALQGERSAALVHYETCRDILAEELGVEPTAETKKLVAYIRRKQAGQAPQPQASRDVNRQRLTIPFVGRKAEYMALRNVYQRAASDGLQVVTLSGKAGIGKTRLSQQFLEWAVIQGADVLYGRSFETGAGLSYQPLAHLLRQRLERENAPDDLLSDLWLSQLTRLLPELRDRYPDLPSPTQEEATAKQHLFEAITRLGRALAERQPLVLFIDDWHWADAASLDVLHYAAVRWAEAKLPIMLLLTLRQEAVSPDLQSWLTRLKHDVTTTQLHLSELSQSETERLIQMLVTPQTVTDADRLEIDAHPSLTQFSHWLFAETDGQPLFLTETLKALVADGLVQPHNSGSGWQIDWVTLDKEGVSDRVPSGVQTVIRSWLDRIDSTARTVITAVSILEQEASFDHICRVTGLEELKVIEALDELLGKQLLLEADEASSVAGLDPVYSFSHQKISEVVYAEAGAARRRMLHRRAFAALQAAAAPAAELAHHAANVGMASETIRYSLVAGNEAMGLFAVQVAIAHYEKAWQVAEQKGWPEGISGADKQALFTALGRAYELAEDWPKARDTYQMMIDYAQAMRANTVECLALNYLATVYLNGFHDHPQALALLEQAKTVAEQNNDRRGLAETELRLANVGGNAGKPSLARHHGEKALAIARELGHHQLLARCLNMLAYAYAQTLEYEKSVESAMEAQQLYATAGNLVLAADSQRIAGWSLIFSGRPQESLLTLQETLAFSQQIENLWGEAECVRMLARTHLELGNYGQAIRMARQAVKQTCRVGHSFMRVLALIDRGTVQRTIMAWDSAQETLLQALAQSTEQDLTILINWVLGELCALHASVGEWEQARDYAKNSCITRRDHSLLSVGLTGWFETEALLRGGEEDLARAEVEQMAEIVGDNKRYRLPLLRSQAVLAQWDKDVDQAISHLKDALALAQEIGLPGEVWPILGELGRLYVDQGDMAQARGAYQEAAKIIHRLADTIDEAELRAGFLAAGPVRAILEIREAI